MDTPQGQKNAVLAFRKAFKSAPWIPISKMQAQSFRERPLKGSILVSKVQIPRPDDEGAELLRLKVCDAFKSKAEGVEKLDPPAACSSYDGEWIGVSCVQDSQNTEVPITDQEKFNLIDQNRRNDLTLFYLSGGAWFRAGPPGARPLIKKLCEQTGSRAFTFQYRLVPQYTLPTLVLDVLTAYFYLLSPPPGSFHEPVDPKKLILVGESGGGILHLDILQFLQYLCSNTCPDEIPRMHFFGRNVPLDMPAGCAIICPGSDLALSLPSVKKYEKSDWLSEGAPWLQPNFPADSIWPSNPPRGDLHCDNSAICHPFIDPSTWTNWTGMPPMWIACGEETYSDGIKFLVRNIKASGVPISFVEYEFMPHVWNVVTPFLPQSQHVMKLWAQACIELGDAATVRERKSEAWYVKLGDLETVQQSFDKLFDLPNNEVLKRMRAARDELAKFVWRGPVAAKI